MDMIIKGAPLGPRVLEVTPNDDYELIITFNNGEQRKFDAKQLFEMKVFEPLKNLSFFKLVKVEFGTVVWPHDIDYCPDTLYMQSVPI
jgi:hypothetical protein